MLAATEAPLLGLASLVVLGIAAQWIAWRTRLPSILLLLCFGFLAGPEVAGLIDADALFGSTLLPIVSLSVAVLLFEGGLTLQLGEVGDSLRVVLKLVTLGAGITWLLASLAAYLLLGFEPAMATLFGAILIVTGPTVVGPLLRQVRPTGAVGSVLKWEGILIDPVGAVTAVLVFEGMTSVGGGAAAGLAVAGVLKTLLLGGGIGLLAAWLLALLLRRFWLPDFLHGPGSLALAIGAFSAANAFQHDAGLLAVTLMGVALANQKRVSVAHIREFEENLRVLILSGLFLLLASRIRFEDVGHPDLGRIAFLVAMFVVVRPVAVYACTARSSLTRAERLWLACVAPRGIVAAAIASVFALRLGEPVLLSSTFVVILGTVAVYGLLAAPLAYRLGLAAPDPQGILLLGASAGARALAKTLHDLGLRVLLVDTNARHIREARMQGLATFRGNLLAEQTDADLDLQGIGRLFALTPNDEVNALAALHYRDLFGRGEVYQLASEGEETPAHLRGRLLPLEYADLRGARFRATKLTSEFPFAEWRARHGEDAAPLLAMDADGRATVAPAGGEWAPEGEVTLVALARGKA